MNGWRILPFEHAIADESGGNEKTPQSEYLPQGRFPVIDQGKALIGGYVDDQTRLCHSQLPVIVFGDHTRCFKYVDFPFCMGADGVKVLRPKIEADAKYLYHFLRQVELPDGGYDRHYKYLKRTDVVLPPITEQQRIADILDRADTLQSKRRSILDQLEALTQFIFLDLFGDPKFNERRWPVCRIGSVISDLRGGANLAPEDFVENGFPILHKGAIKTDGVVALDTRKKTFATPEYAAANSRCQIDRKYLAVTLRDLVPTGPSIGLIAELKDGPFDHYLLAQGAYGFLVDPSKVTAEYLVYLSNMPNFRHLLRKYSVGSTQIHIRTPVYLDIPIPLPSLSIQHEFSQRVAAVRRLRTKQLSSSAALNVLFRSLQARAFVEEI